MSCTRCILSLVLVLVFSGCLKNGGGGSTVTTITTSLETTSIRETVTMTSILKTTLAPTTTSTLKPETTYTTISTGTCFDRIRNQGEAGIDCGGPCTACNIECASDEDCGDKHYGKQYCKEDDSGIWYIMRDLIGYKCRNPGEWNASCILSREPEKMQRCPAHRQCVFTNFCPGREYSKCEEARCILKEDVCDWIFC